MDCCANSVKYRSKPVEPYAQSGFTLLEVLIAIGITALIGLGAWQVLNSAITSSDRTQVHLEKLNQIQKAMLIIKRDLSQLVGRSVRDEYGDYQSALDSGAEFYKLEFSRVGWRNPLDDKRSEIQRVAYEYEDGNLYRNYWLVLDRTHDSEHIRKRLLSEVESIEFRFLDDKDEWKNKWPGDVNTDVESADSRYETNKMPKAIEIKLIHKAFGEVSRTFQVTTYLAEKEIKIESDKSEDESNNSGSNNDSTNPENETSEES